MSTAIIANNETTSPASKPSKEDKAVRLTDEQVTKGVLKDMMKIADPSRFQQDAACVGLATCLGRICYFHQTFHIMSYFMDDTTKVSPTGGSSALPEDLAGLSMRELGERLHSKAMEEGRAFVKSYQYMRRLLTRELPLIAKDFDRHTKKGKLSDGDSPMSLERCRKRLSTEDVRDAAKKLTTDSHQLVKETELFLHNVYQSNKLPMDARVLLDCIQQKEMELKKESHALSELQKEEACLKGKVAKIDEDLKSTEKNMQGDTDTLEDLKRKLEDVCKQKEDAMRDEKNYTYRMFGPHTHQWENDVKLANRKVHAFSQEQNDLESKLAERKSGDTEPIKQRAQQYSKLKEDAAQTKELLKCKSSEVMGVQSKLEKLNMEVDKDKEKLNSMVEDAGSKSVQHMLMASTIINEFAKQAFSGATRGDETAREWDNEIACIADRLEDLFEATTGEEQLDALEAIKDCCDTPVFEMMIAGQDTLSIEDGPDMQRYFQSSNNGERLSRGALGSSCDRINTPSLEDVRQTPEGAAD